MTGAEMIGAEMSGPERPTARSGAGVKVLVAKLGLDGHDVGAKLVCRALRDAGCDVVYTGLRQSPQAVAEAARREKVDIIGLSILSGAHVPLCRKVMAELRSAGLGEVPVVVGGAIPEADHEPLREMGLAAVLPVGTDFDTVVDTIVREAGR